MQSSRFPTSVFRLQSTTLDAVLMIFGFCEFFRAHFQEK